MSTFDFNHNNNQYQNANSNHGANETSNGSVTTSKYQPVNDYMNQSFTTTSQMDMSVQLTRPTSKTAMLVRQKRAMLEQLSCFICKGYLIDATVIEDCMDSFCKSCLVRYLRNHNNCPKCGQTIHKPDPFGAIKPDKVLQDIVYKLVPGLYDDEMKRRRDFYRKKHGGSPSSSSEDEDESNSSSSLSERNPNLNEEQYGIISYPKPFYKPSDDIDLSIEPQTSGNSSVIYYDNKRQSIVTTLTGTIHNHQQQQLFNSIFSTVESQQFKTYLRCPAKLTVAQLKKFISAKFNISKDDSIYLLYLNDSLEDEYSLIDVAYIYDWRGTKHMSLFYIIERDFTKISTDPYYQEAAQSNKSNARPKSASSTQTTKKVRIDPEPKYYLGRDGDTQTGDNQNDGMSSRLTRSKTDAGSNLNTYSRCNQTSRTPMLRSSSTSHVESKVNQTVNGLSKRESTPISGPRVTGLKPSIRSSITAAVNEANRICQEIPKETRSSRKLIAETAPLSGTIPKININLNSLSRKVENSGGDLGTKLGNESSVINQKKLMINPNNVRQLVSYVNKGFSGNNSGTSGGPVAQSSLVTLASFTETRSNHVVSVNTGSSRPIVTASYKNASNAGTSASSLDRRSNNIVSSSQRVTAGSGSPLAFSFVTERGIKIVRGLNNQQTEVVEHRDTTSSISHAKIDSTGRTESAYTQINRNIIDDSNISRGQRSGSNSISNHPGYAKETCSSVANLNQETLSSRHLVKIKPVYKTLVDPTKVKTPNFKKFGHSTARH